MHRPQPLHSALLTVFAALVLVAGLLGAAEPPPRVPADDLPEEFRLLSGLPAGSAFSWRLLVRNEKVREQEAEHPEANAVQEVWHVPLRHGRHAFRIVFSRPYTVSEHVFHLYIDADLDPATGRKSGAVGVDYMYTFSCKTPGTEQEWWAFWDRDGASTSPSYLSVRRDAVLYLCVDMEARQQDGASAFELRTNSYTWHEKEGTWQPTVNHSVGPVRVVGDPEPPAVVGEVQALLLNPALEWLGGRVPGWWLRGGGRPVEATLERDAAEQALRVGPLYAPEGLLQPLSAAPGHYLLRALARTDVFQVHLVAGNMQMPVAVGTEFRWVELPFVIKQAAGRTAASLDVGFRYCHRPATGNASRLPARLWVRQVELRRLGDTVLQEGWIESLPVHRLHHLDLLEASPSRQRPGKVVFQDSFIGTELWLMTQGGQDDHSYVGHPDFSRDGTYLHIGARRPPGGLLRTDGTARYLDDRWQGLVWPFPWMDRLLPPGENPGDWVVVSRSASTVELENAVTGARHTITLPTRPGWTVVHYPGMTDYGLRGPRIPAITHDTLVWLADDGRSVATSNAAGRHFRRFDVPSLSPSPAQDQVSPGMSFVGGKSGDNWRDAVDGEGVRYFFFELNRDKLPDDATNPYQILALPLTGKPRGLLRVVPHPAGPVTEYVTSQTGPTEQPSAKWWDYAAGFPWSGDDARLRLEDGTLVHMSSLGMHSGFHTGGTASTVNLVGLAGETDRFVGTYHKLDRITWPHEFRRDRDFAVVEGYAEPASPLLMIDLEHQTQWTAALTHFHDYLKRYSSRWNEKAYHKPMFRPAPTFSPDFTKVSYFSPMLTGDVPERLWGDVYVAVVRYPEPPRNLRLGSRRTLTWELPRRHTEIRGYRLYRAAESGRGYQRAGDALLTGTEHRLPADAEGFYALTSVEHSGLEGRLFSNEVRLGDEAPFRHFHEAETGRIEAPMVPFFEPAEASGAYAVAVTDPERLARQALAAGLRGTVTLTVPVPARQGLRLWARVRGMSELERASYTRGWPDRGGTAASGALALHCKDRLLGHFAVAGPDWQWVPLDAGAFDLPARTADLVLSTSDAGVALDCLCVTDDPGFQPAGRGREPTDPPAAPAGLRMEELTLADAQQLPIADGQVKLAWQPSSALQGVTRYQVYRGDTADFEAGPEHLLGSPSQPCFYDTDLQVGRQLFYRVRAMDAWGNLSAASPTLRVTAAPASLRPAFEYRRQAVDPRQTVIAFDARASQCAKGAINRWEWAFGDSATGAGPETAHAYAKPGRYLVTLQLTTDQGAGARLQKTLQIDPTWVEAVRTGQGLWIEAEEHSAEGGGTSRIVSGRINASDRAVTFWEKDLGHWLEWTFAVNTPGTYAIALRYASGSAQARRDGLIDGTSPGEAWSGLPFPGTGGYSNQGDNWAWQLLTSRDGTVLRHSFAAGTHTLRLINQGGGMALDAILLAPASLLPPSP